MRLVHEQGYAGKPHPTIRSEAGSSYRLPLPFTVYRAWIPRTYGATSERKCLASFSIRFN